MSEKIICPSCQAENDGNFNYCVLCGAHLNAQNEPVLNTPVTTKNIPLNYSTSTDAIPVNIGNNSQTDNYYDGLIAPDITVEEASVFVGNNQSSLISKFINFKNGGSASWNWPVFLFQYFLNIGFVWFFHRKMKKQGFVALLLSALIMISSIVSMYFVLKPIFKVSSELLEETYNSSFGYYSDYYNDNYYNYNEFENYDPDYVLNFFTEEDYFHLGLGVVLSAFVSLLSIAYTIVLPIVANKIYYNHCLKKIRSIKAVTGDTSAYIPTLSATGGTANGLAVTTGLLLWVGYIFATITVVVVMFSQVLFSSGLL